MDSYSEVLMEDLIDCNEDSLGLPHSSWTEQALDLFISILKNVKRDNFANDREMLEIIALKMSGRGYSFNTDQVEKKYNSLKKMYTEKKQKNQTVEPELSKLFGDNGATCSVRVQRPEQPPQKRAKLDVTDDEIQDSDKCAESLTIEDSEEKKVLWPTEATKMFLDLLETLRPQLGSKLRTKKQMWEEISKKLRAHGYSFTSTQVENKWKALLRHYRGRLELIRNGGATRIGVFDKLKHNLRAWPEFFESSSESIKHMVSDISFANDQKLPYEDDGYTDEEPYQFEDACSLPDIEVISDETDPVLIEVKPTTDQLKEDVPSSSNEPQNHSAGIPQLERIVKEIVSFREENRKHQKELFIMKQMELRAYKERTVQFTRIGDGLSELMGYLKRNELN